MEIANRLIDNITDRFLLLARYPFLGRSREDNFGIGSRSFAVGDYVIVYTVESEDVFILRVAMADATLTHCFRVRVLVV